MQLGEALATRQALRTRRLNGCSGARPPFFNDPSYREGRAGNRRPTAGRALRNHRYQSPQTARHPQNNNCNGNTASWRKDPGSSPFPTISNNTRMSMLHAALCHSRTRISWLCSRRCLPRLLRSMRLLPCFFGICSEDRKSRPL
jgi:hypothetical protein